MVMLNRRKVSTGSKEDENGKTEIEETKKPKNKKPNRADARKNYIAKQKEKKASQAKVNALTTKTARGSEPNEKSIKAQDEHDKKYKLGEYRDATQNNRSDKGKNKTTDVKPDGKSDGKPDVKENSSKLKKPVIENGELPKFGDVKKYFKSIGKEVSEAQTYYESLVAELEAMKKKGKTNDNTKTSTENNKSSTESSTENKKPLTTLLAENRDKDVIASVGKTLLSKLKKGKKMKRTSSGFRPIRRK